MRRLSDISEGNKMKVWLMNLKDNREAPPALEKSKFAFCRENGIVGIGWVGEDPADTENTAYLQAHTALFSFAPGDLVWVHDADGGIYCLCKITAPAAPTSDNTFHRYDIGEFCQCVFFEVGDAAALPKGITPQTLVSRRTVSVADETVSAITQQSFARWETAKKQKKPKLRRNSALLHFLKNPAALACTCVLLSALLTTGIVLLRNYSYKEKLYNTFEMVEWQAELAQKGGLLQREVWYNTIYKISDSDTDKYTKSESGGRYFNSDFNDSLAAMASDRSTDNDYYQAVVCCILFDLRRKAVKNPPRIYKKEYDTLIKYINAVDLFSSFVVDAEGYSLKSYTEEFYSQRSNVQKAHMEAAPFFQDN